MTLDLSGIESHELLAALDRATSGQPPGALVEIIATDLRAPGEIAAWSHQHHFDVLESSQIGTVLRFVLRTRIAHN